MKQQLEAAHKTMDGYIDVLETARDSVDDKDLMIPYSCCYWNVMRKKLIEAIRPNCNTESETYLTAFVDGVVEDVLDLNCNTFEYGSQKCDKLIAEKPIVAAANKTTRAKSFLIPLSDIFTNL